MTDVFELWRMCLNYANCSFRSILFWTLKQHSNNIQTTFKQHSNNIQTTFKQHSNNIQTTFRQHSNNIQTTFKQHSNNIQTTFRQRSNNIQTTFKQHSDNIQTTFRLKRPYCENFWWKHIKNESCKYYLGNKEPKAMFLILSGSDVHFGFEHPFLRALSLRKIGRLERNLSTPAHSSMFRYIFSFFYFNLTYNSTNFLKGICFLTTMTSISMLDWVF